MRQIPWLKDQLNAAEGQLCAAKDQLMSQSTALQESGKGQRRLQASLRAAEQRATQAEERLAQGAGARDELYAVACFFLPDATRRLRAFPMTTKV